MSEHNKSRTSTLALAALGVVYGDIGTSPLYTIHEIFAGAHHPVPITSDNILGILSVIFWSLMIVVALKYVVFVMRADNRGEGGIMALMALVQRSVSNRPYGPLLMLLGLFGAALFYGDSVITPAISVLSAVEGLEIVTPAFKPYIIPISLTVLIGLFLVQKQGTSSIGKFFGPVVVLWFSSLGLLGIINIAAAPQVLAALNPVHALRYFMIDPTLGYFSLGATVLAVTGAEALYADMGHFGRKPVQLAWFGLVLPGLVLNYYGQGALLLVNPQAIANPFYLMAPNWALLPMVVLATAATVIASQAVISGTYSITQQAMQLGYVPRMEIQHTSQQERGQIYLPGINWALMIAVAVLVVGFGSSTKLAAAYGIAVTGTMVITTLLAFVVVRKLWGWGWGLSLAVAGSFLAVDIVYFSANLLKIGEGGWFPLLLGLGVFILMITWKQGRALLYKRLSSDALPLTKLVENASKSGMASIPGTAIFLTPNTDMTPHALLHSLKHYKSLHEQVVILTVETLDIPHVKQDQVKVEQIDERFFRVKVMFGFMDQPDLPKALEDCASHGLALDMMNTSFFLGRETLIPKIGSDMALWREKLFVTMFRNAGSAAIYFRLPPNRVVELGTQVVL
ncbi:MAG: potassium transporter Kup [Methylophilales bacterium]|nr:potassium transporter Kup [Methylophilales bacterium]